MNVRLALISLVLVSLTAGTAAAGSVGHATSTDTNPAVLSPLAAQQESENGTASLNQSIYEAQPGDTVAMNLTLDGLDTVTVLIGDKTEYELNATVTDGNGDGTVVLLFDTAQAGSGDGSALTARGDADEIEVKNETSGDLGSAMHGVVVYAGSGDEIPEIAFAGIKVEGNETATTTDETTTTDTTDEGTTEGGGQPGFGVTLAVAALAAVALLARRR